MCVRESLCDTVSNDPLTLTLLFLFGCWQHVDGAGKVDGSCVVALPIDRWSAPEEVNSFVGHGGGLTFWDGRDPSSTSTKGGRGRPREIHYETRSGDVAFIDRAVWHQADPITKGTRWALVIFFDVQTTLVVE